MVVGEYVAAGADDDAAAQADLRLGARLVAKEITKPGVFFALGASGDLAGVDANHRARGRFGGRPQAAGPATRRLFVAVGRGFEDCDGSFAGAG